MAISSLAVARLLLLAAFCPHTVITVAATDRRLNVLVAVLWGTLVILWFCFSCGQFWKSLTRYKTIRKVVDTPHDRNEYESETIIDT
jgi:hypothetical protein